MLISKSIALAETVWRESLSFHYDDPILNANAVDVVFSIRRKHKHAAASPMT